MPFRHFSEEVENPRRNVLLATVLVCVVTGSFVFAEVYAAQLVWGSKPFPAEQWNRRFRWWQAGGRFFPVSTAEFYDPHREHWLRDGRAVGGCTAALRDGPQRRASEGTFRQDQAKRQIPANT